MFPAGTKILIADDTRVIRILLIEILIKLGYKNYREAEDGKEALNLLKGAAEINEPFDLIICDWNMPGLTGLDLLEVRNTDIRFRHIPFLMVTIESERDYVLKAVTMGVSDFVVKPFNESIIRNKLQNIWNRMQKDPNKKWS